ncbi:hypothetical protein NDU88_007423 [Pleurodeles waltl]|uniref:Uncharacterized protein n=1 Tax=Pleurodeles waltl TaxID=8319 RepID=A0AAV7VSH9_PLEWA|nr:hypothetical protein NDU88_007423 [Pleurodeles waltl]
MVKLRTAELQYGGHDFVTIGHGGASLLILYSAHQKPHMEKHLCNLPLKIECVRLKVLKEVLNGFDTLQEFALVFMQQAKLYRDRLHLEL